MLAATGTASFLTEVELIWVEKQIEHWIRFGRPVSETILDRRRRIVRYEPGQVFAYVRWASNTFGTVISRLDILRAAEPGKPYTQTGKVVPGGEPLLRLSGWPRVAAALEIIDAVEAHGIDPADICPDYWLHVGNRLCVGERPHGYSLIRHAAWLRRRTFQ
jgi:hypothetical protein